MNNINVIFEIPFNILEGLKNGTLERVGGVVRDSESKKVVGWLKETGLSEPSDTTPKIPSIMANQQLMMGMQVANLAVSAAGFAMIYYKLDKVEKLLQAVDVKINHIKQNQDWLNTKQLLENISPVIASIKKINGIENIQGKYIAKQLLLAAEDHTSIKKEYFRSILGKMLAEYMENHRPEEFAACYRAWLMSAQGSINTMLALNEPSMAKNRITDLKKEHTEFGKLFQQRRSNVISRIKAGSDAQKADGILNILSMQMAGAHEIIKGQAIQLEFAEANDISSSLMLKDARQSNSPYAFCEVQ